MTTGEKIKRLRKQLGMTQEELGNLIGVQKAAINKYETGIVVNLKQATINSLAKALHVSPVELLSPDDPPDITSEEIPKNDDIRLLIRGLNKLSPEQVEQAKNMMKVMFAKYADYFEKESDDES